MSVKGTTADLLEEPDPLRKRIADLERELRSHEQQFQTLAQSSPVGIFQTDADGVSIYANERYQEILGLSFDEAIGDGWMQRLHPDDRDFVIRRWQVAAQKQETCRLEHRFVTPDRKTTWVYCQAVPIKNEDGVLTGYVGTVVDITDRKHAQQSLAELAHVARLSTMGEMMAGLAHEINQPLTAIANFSDAGKRLLESGGKNFLQRAKKLFHDIGDQAFRSGEIIRRLRGLARKTEPHRSTVDLNSLIREIVELHRFHCTSSDTRIVLELDSAIPAIVVDPIQIQQVVLNLLNNARDAIIALSGSPRTIIIATWLEGQETVHVSVADTGIGLPSEDPKQLFEAFYTTKKDGMGMGLAISRSIVESHGGQLRAIPNADHGATFEFTLPRKNEASDAQP